MSSAFPALLSRGGPTQVRGASKGDLEAYYPLDGGVALRGDMDFNRHNLQNIGDFWANWDGVVPIDLSGGEDATATKGIAFDASAGAIQALAFYGSVAPPTGGITAFGGATAPSGWLLCDGTAYDSVTDTQYAPLYNVIGNTYGGTDGTDFQVPDARDRFIIGKSGTIALGDTGGSFDHDHTGPSHSHSHNHTGTASGTTGGSLLGVPTSLRSVTDDGTSQVNVGSSTHGHPSHSHSFSDGFTTSTSAPAGGTGATGTNNPPYLGLNAIIKI